MMLPPIVSTQLTALGRRHLDEGATLIARLSTRLFLPRAGLGFAVARHHKGAARGCGTGRRQKRFLRDGVALAHVADEVRINRFAGRGFAFDIVRSCLQKLIDFRPWNVARSVLIDHPRQIIGRNG